MFLSIILNKIKYIFLGKKSFKDLVFFLRSTHKNGVYKDNESKLVQIDCHCCCANSGLNYIRPRFYHQQ